MLGWLKKGRTDAILAALTPVIDGTVCNGRSLSWAPSGTKSGLRGSYRSHLVEAWPKRLDPRPSASTGSGVPSEPLNIFEIALAGVPGRQHWECHSWPSVNPLAAPDFRFEGGEWLAKKLTAFAGLDPPLADAALKERLVAAGLFEELSLLRRPRLLSGVSGVYAARAYLPKLRYTPSGRAMQEAYLARTEGARKEWLRAKGHPEFESLMEERLRAAWAEDPGGRLQCEVELGDDPVPTPERFHELLDHLLRLAEINALANPEETSSG